MEKQIKRMFWENDGKCIAPSFELEDGQIKRPAIINGNFMYLTQEEHDKKMEFFNRLNSIKWWQFWK